MADRRMFSKRIINSARFLKMPVSTQCLYFHLGLHADDDGIVEAYTIINSVGASEDDLKVLVAKGFVTVLNDDLVTYITDWAENNKIRSDRKVDSIYKDLLLQVLPEVNLQQKTIRADVKKKPDVHWTSTGQPMDGIGKDRLGKDRLGKDRLGEVREGKDRLGEDKAIVSVDTICSNDLERICESWNSLSDLGINQIRGIVEGTKRHSQVKKRIRDYGLDAVLIAIERIRVSKFLQGKATDFTITFDWFIRPNNFIKVYEGNYDDKSTGSKGADMLERSYEMMKEWSETDG